MVNSVRLEPGANIALTANNPLLREVTVGFGWQVQGAGAVTELVPSAILTDANNRALSDEHFVFFNQLASPDGAVTYVTGEDTEQLDVDLSAVPDVVQKIVFIVYADPDLRHAGNFGTVRNAYIHVDDRRGGELARFDLTQVTPEVTAVIFGELYRHNGAWKFRAGGQGYTTGLVGVAKDYGVTL